MLTLSVSHLERYHPFISVFVNLNLDLIGFL